jgi:hypothetical protein
LAQQRVLPKVLRRTNFDARLHHNKVVAHGVGESRLGAPGGYGTGLSSPSCG